MLTCGCSYNKELRRQRELLYRSLELLEQVGHSGGSTHPTICADIHMQLASAHIMTALDPSLLPRPPAKKKSANGNSNSSVEHDCDDRDSNSSNSFNSRAGEAKSVAPANVCPVNSKQVNRVLSGSSSNAINNIIGSRTASANRRRRRRKRGGDENDADSDHRRSDHRRRWSVSAPNEDGDPAGGSQSKAESAVRSQPVLVAPAAALETATAAVANLLQSIEILRGVAWSTANEEDPLQCCSQDEDGRRVVVRGEGGEGGEDGEDGGGGIGGIPGMNHQYRADASPGVGSLRRETSGDSGEFSILHEEIRFSLARLMDSTLELAAKAMLQKRCYYWPCC